MKHGTESPLDVMSRFIIVILKVRGSWTHFSGEQKDAVPGLVTPVRTPLYQSPGLHQYSWSSAGSGEHPRLPEGTKDLAAKCAAQPSRLASYPCIATLVPCSRKPGCHPSERLTSLFSLAQLFSATAPGLTLKTLQKVQAGQAQKINYTAHVPQAPPHHH